MISGTKAEAILQTPSRGYHALRYHAPHTPWWTDLSVAGTRYHLHIRGRRLQEERGVPHLQPVSPGAEAVVAVKHEELGPAHTHTFAVRRVFPVVPVTNHNALGYRAPAVTTRCIFPDLPVTVRMPLIIMPLVTIRRAFPSCTQGFTLSGRG